MLHHSNPPFQIHLRGRPRVGKKIVEKVKAANENVFVVVKGNKAIKKEKGRGRVITLKFENYSYRASPPQLDATFDRAGDQQNYMRGCNIQH